MPSVSPYAGSQALIVVDMQNAFCDAGGSFARMGHDMSACRAAVDGCLRLVTAARSVGVPVIYVTYAYQAQYADGGYLVRCIHPEVVAEGALLANTWDTEIVAPLAPRSGDAVIVKNRYSAFVGTTLHALLQSSRRTSLVVCGVTTNICVESTVRDAAQLDYEVDVASDATGEIDAERGRVSLRTIEHAFGRVLDTTSIANHWSSSAS